MTNQERAENMHKALYCHFDCEGYDKKDVDKILLAGLDKAVSDALKDREILYEKDLKMRIDEAVGEVVASYDKRCLEHSDIEYKRGFAAAREKAALIADEICDPDEGYPITVYAERIRAMEDK